MLGIKYFPLVNSMETDLFSVSLIGLTMWRCLIQSVLGCQIRLQAMLRIKYSLLAGDLSISNISHKLDCVTFPSLIHTEVLNKIRSNIND